MQRHGWCGGNACSVTAQPQAVIGMLRMCTVLPHDGVDDVAYRMLHITSSMLCALRVGCRCIAYAYATVDAAPCTDAVRHSCRVDLADGDNRLRFQRRYLRSIQERCSSRDCRSKVSLRDSVQQRGRWTPYAMHFASRASADVAASTPAETAVCAESVQSSRLGPSGTPQSFMPNAHAHTQAAARHRKMEWASLCAARLSFRTALAPMPQWPRGR